MIGEETHENTLARQVEDHWGIRVLGLQKLPSGHTNTTYRVHTDAGHRILRVSWLGKPRSQLRREAMVLTHLREAGGALPASIPTPAINPAACASLSVSLPLSVTQTVDGRWLQLFEHIPGQPGSGQLSAAMTHAAVRVLAALHQAMESLPVRATSPVAWLLRRYRSVCCRGARSHGLALVPAAQQRYYNDVIAHIGVCLQGAPSWLPGPVHWLHGDYHAGNLLFRDDTLAGIVDFDEVGIGAHRLEIAFALFALARDVTIESCLTIDPDRWDAGLRAYAQMRPETDVLWFEAQRDRLLTLFCADQVLIHLAAAQRGSWTLGPGIGFLGCWNQLLISR